MYIKILNLVAADRMYGWLSWRQGPRLSEPRPSAHLSRACDVYAVLDYDISNKLWLCMYAISFDHHSELNDTHLGRRSSSVTATGGSAVVNDGQCPAVEESCD